MDLAAPRIPKTVKNAEVISHGDDSTVIATFSDSHVKNEYRSENEGRAIYDHYIEVNLVFAGNNLNTYAYRFTKEDGEKGNEWTQRFPRQWDAFLAQKEQVPDGMPIEIWAPLDKHRVMLLKAMRIHTVEQIAGMTDQTGPNMGLDWRKLRDMAKATLSPADGAVEISKLTRMVEDLKNQLEAYQKQPIQTEPQEEPKRRGRSAKIIDAA